MSAIVDLVGTETFFKSISQSVEMLWPKNRFSRRTMGKIRKISKSSRAPSKVLKMTAMVDLMGTETFLSPYFKY